MGKVGRFVSDPKVGAYCHVTLDSGEKLIVNHDKGSLEGGRVVIEVRKFMGLGSTPIFQCDLDGAEGKAALAQIMRGAEPQSMAATPLGAFVEYVRHGTSVEEVKRLCAALVPRPDA